MTIKSEDIELVTCIIKGLASSILKMHGKDANFVRPMINENAETVIKSLKKLNSNEIYHLGRLLKRARELRFETNSPMGKGN